MLIALIKKDLRLCLLPLLAGLVLLLGPFGMVAAMVRSMPLWTEATPASAWAVLLGTGCYFSVMCSQPTLAMISGHIFAAERGDRSAEFLAYLPVSKLHILSSKLLVLLSSAAILWGFNGAIGWLASSLAGGTDAAQTLTAELASYRYLAAVGLVACGTGWLASTTSSSSGLAVALAFSAPLLVSSGLMLLRYLTEWPSEFDFPEAYLATCLIWGAVSFVAGTILFLRRVEP